MWRYFLSGKSRAGSADIFIDSDNRKYLDGYRYGVHFINIIWKAKFGDVSKRWGNKEENKVVIDAKHVLAPGFLLLGHNSFNV